MTFLAYLQCSSCGEKFDADKLWNLCPVCEKPLLARYDLDLLQRDLKKEELARREHTIWRFRELLPVKELHHMITLGEGYTPLISAQNLVSLLGIQQIYIKDEGINPTGSFKARGLAVAVARARELGATQLSIPSAGNAAGALSAYAAAAGLPAYVYLPRDVPQNFIAECKALGANIRLVDGLISDCGRISKEEAQKYGRFDLSTLKEPYRVEGKKTMGYELAEQFDWDLPEVIIYPTGGGTGMVGMWKAFEELEQLGWINKKRPRMVAVQPEGCAPIVRAFKEKKSEAAFWENARTIADGLRVPSAVGDFIILKILSDSQGTALTVTDQEMIDGANLLGKTQGLFVSPESGATIAALQKLKDNGWLQEMDRIVLFNTGNGCKYSHLWF